MRPGIAAIMALLAAAPTPAAASEPLGRDDLLSALRAADAWTAPDAFSRRPDDTALIGQRVRLVLPVAPRGPNASVFWTYDAGSERMSVHGLGKMWHVQMALWAAGSGPRGGVNLTHGVPLWQTTVDRGEEVRTNGLVNISVARSRWRGLGVSAVGGGSPIERFIYQPSFAIAPDAARAAASTLRWVGEGEVVAHAPDRAVSCADNMRQATVRDPKEEMRRFCVVSVRFDRVAIEADGGRTVLDEWVRPGTGQAAAPASHAGPPAASVGSGGFPAGARSVQIGVYPNPALAERELASVAATFPAYAQGRQRSVQAITTQAGATAYRALFTQMAAGDADTLCQAMRGVGQACLVR